MSNKDKNLEYLTGMELDFITETTELILDVELCIREDGYVGYPQNKEDEFKRVYDILANNYILWKYELKNQDNE